MLVPKRLYPLLACAGIMMAVVAAVVGQIESAPYLDSLHLTLGEYAVLGGGGGAIGFALAALAGASLATVAGLRAAAAPVGTAAERLLLVWSAALAVLAVLPALAPGLDAEAAAQAYRYTSIVAFAAVPAAGGLMAAGFRRDERWRPVAAPVEWLALAGGFGLLALVYVALPGHGVLIGLVERVTLVIGTALIGVPAVRVARLTWARGATRASQAALG
ncbi:hypothetical protein FHS43_000130 [Streptosporangium becharense]|uniref:DUF998 domain-containing protein n=1 Tax=Streptosporangium becharense TaxID=1816182 RepID=A0A7W9IG92_9ACTN|nr:DUF998 domain-containing protein [Streptosporangium becharense]MBB2908884.1 hypothetical protein [Streptosporangium becharense]MBB5820098.1 hypothetical protein [Streptosporangium becharense]